MTYAALDRIWCASDAGDDLHGLQPGVRRVASVDRADALVGADRAVIARAEAGDETAFREVYLANVQSLWRFAYRFTRDADTATDIVQDVFVSLWVRRGAWHVTGTVRSYLFSAVRQRALAAHRDAGVAARAAERVAIEAIGMGRPETDIANRVEQDELSVAIARAIDTLPERQRTAVLLRVAR